MPYLERHELKELTDRIAELEATAASYKQQVEAMAMFMPQCDRHRLTMNKAESIIKRGYEPTGFVLTLANGDKCIVDHSAVRWMDGEEFFATMHSDSTMAQQLAAANAEIERVKKDAERWQYTEKNLDIGKVWVDMFSIPMTEIFRRWSVDKIDAAMSAMSSKDLMSEAKKKEDGK